MNLPENRERTSLLLLYMLLWYPSFRMISKFRWPENMSIICNWRKYGHSKYQHCSPHICNLFFSWDSFAEHTYFLKVFFLQEADGFVNLQIMREFQVRGTFDLVHTPAKENKCSCYWWLVKTALLFRFGVSGHFLGYFGFRLNFQQVAARMTP